jgi:hypothetical protein
VIQIVVFAPPLHGRTGPLDELSLCLTPIVVGIVLLAHYLLKRRAAGRADRVLRQRRAPRDRDRG